MKESKRLFVTLLIGIALLMAWQVPSVQSYINQKVSIAVDGGNYDFEDVKDAASNQNINDGVVPVRGYIWNGTNMEGAEIGNGFYAIKNTIPNTASANFAFGFPAKKVALEFPSGNSDEVCVDWDGGTAVCPGANTAGDDRYAANRSIILDGVNMSSVSLIADSGSQTVYIRAWR